MIPRAVDIVRGQDWDSRLTEELFLAGLTELVSLAQSWPSMVDTDTET